MLAALVLLAAAGGMARAQDDRPNILLIVADDAGYSDLGSFGGEIQTPNLDALAAIGIRFTDFTAAPTCSPTRSMLLTGTDNHLAGLGNMAEQTAPNQEGVPGYEGYLNERVAVLPELLQEAGYNTFMAGKWHMGEEPEHWPAARGFDRDLTLIPGGGSHLDDMWGLTGERQPYTFNGQLLRTLRPGFHSSVDYTAAIIRNVEEFRDSGRPFFAYLALQAPHDPFQPPEEWRDRYSGRYDEGYETIRAARIARMMDLGLLDREATVFPRLPNVPAWSELSAEERRESARKMELYAATLEHMDANIGELIGYLKATGQFENTLIFFMSDNGPEGNFFEIGAPWDNSRFGDWGKQGTFIQYGPAWAQVGAGPLRMFKGFVTEGGIRVPLIVAGEGVAGSGRIEDSFAHVMDIPATILDVAGVSHPGAVGTDIEALQGKSLAPLLADPAAEVRSPSDWIGWELFGNSAVRMGDWKMVRLCAPFGTGDWQLYDLAADPGETIDLASERPEIRDQLLEHWDEYVETNNVIYPDISPLCGPAE
jgi:arylsulfatase